MGLMLVRRPELLMFRSESRQVQVKKYRYGSLKNSALYENPND